MRFSIKLDHFVFIYTCTMSCGEILQGDLVTETRGQTGTHDILRIIIVSLRTELSVTSQHRCETTSPHWR